jgi:predicted HTH transcriptional regulator
MDGKDSEYKNAQVIVDILTHKKPAKLGDFRRIGLKPGAPSWVLDEYESWVKYRSLPKPERIKALIEGRDRITEEEIIEHCPDISKRTIERTLDALAKSGQVVKDGESYTAHWRDSNG